MYIKVYGGLSRASWMLALIQLINRSGSMVLPFLAVYMTTSLGYTVQQAGLIMSVYGIGSLIGSYLGGWLTDRYGAFWVQVFALCGGGVTFLFLPLLQSYPALMAGIFISSIVVETLRPANSTSVSLYSNPETLTRSFSLNRMAINLGVSFGPAIGGLLAGVSYTLLFVADGITCMTAGLVFYFYFRKRPGNQRSAPQSNSTEPIVQPIRDLPYLAFAVCCGLYAFLFLQIFQVLPLFYGGPGKLSEAGIGLLLGFNGLIVFAIEMVLVYHIESRFRLSRLIIMGTLLCGLSFVVLQLGTAIGILYLGMLLLSLSEILAMPFMITLIMQRAGERSRGSYMGIYTMSWSLAFIVSPGVTTSIIDMAGYSVLWWFNGLLALITMAGFYVFAQKMEHKAIAEPVSQLLEHP